MNSNFTPTESQSKIADAVVNGNRNVAVIAGPGSGKTTTIEWIIRTQLPKNAKSLYLTFTNALADPARKRMPKSNTVVSTIHGIGYALMAQEFTYGWVPEDHKYGFPLGKVLANKLNTKEKEFWTTRESLLKLFDFARFNLSDFSEKSLFEIATDNSLDYSPMAKEMLPYLWDAGMNSAIDGVYFNGKKTKVWDFTDMISLPVALGIQPLGGMKIGKKGEYQYWPNGGFDFIFIDEYQDLNLLQNGLLQLIAGDAKIILIGDPMQSIYNFAGAFPGMMERGIEQFGAETCTLYDNWRNPKPVVDMLNTRFGTELIPKKSDGELIHGNWRDWIKDLTPDTAILTRAMRGSKSEAFQFIATCLSNGIELNIAGLELKKTANRLVKMAKESAKSSGFELRFENLPNELLMLVASAPKYQREELSEQAQMVTAFAEFSKAKTFDQFDKFLLEFEKNKKGRPTLTTGHKSKGNEWDNVIILGADSLPAYRKGMTERQKKQEYFLDFVMNSRARNLLMRSNTPNAAQIVVNYDDESSDDE